MKIEDYSDSIDSAPLFDVSSINDRIKLIDYTSKTNNGQIVKIKNENDHGFTFGVAVPRNHPSSIDYLRELDDYNTNLNLTKQIELCRKLYTYEGIVGTAIDILIDLTISKFKVERLANKKAEKIVEYFTRNVNRGNNNIPKGVYSLYKAIIFEYYLSGNVFPYSKWGTYQINGLTQKVKLPMNIFTIDPTIIEIPKESISFGNKVINLSIEKIFNTKYLSNLEIKKRLEKMDNIPVRLKNKIKTGHNVELNPYFVYHIKRRGSMYSGWGIPYLSRVFGAVASKRKLRILDDNTIDGIINSITIFKIGDKDVEGTWDPNRITAFKNLINNPSASMMLAWGWDIDYIHISPSGEILKFSERYKDANQDILYALGIPISILTGAGEKAGDIWASILFLLERLEDCRSEFKAYMEDLLYKIMEQNGLSDIEPEIRFIKPKINKEDIRNVVLSYWDRGLLSKEQALEEAGYDLEAELKRREEEKSSGIDDIMERPSIPFSPKNNNPNPQTNSPSQKQMNKNPKNTKTTNVNQKMKKVTPRLDGDTKSDIVSANHSLATILYNIYEKSGNNLDYLYSNMLSYIDDIHTFDPSLREVLTEEKLTNLINSLKDKEDISFEDILIVLNNDKYIY